MSDEMRKEMKNTYAASLCRNGILGGGLCIQEDKLVFRTGKVTVPQRLRNLELSFKDIDELNEESVLLLPAVTVKMKGGEEWKFIVYSRSSFLANLKERL